MAQGRPVMEARDRLLGELDKRWRAMFADLAGGDDVAPGRRLRAEGLMEAVQLLQLATAAELDQAMARCFLDTFGRELVAEFGEDWREFYPFPQIPAVGRRAPVYPSTHD
jgi:hypothetical protein